MSGELTPARQFLRSSGVMTLLYAGSTGLTFAVGALLAQLLGAAGYGIYALALTAATLVGMITEFGLPVLVLREVGTARASGDWSELRGLLLWSDRVILALSAMLIVGTFAVITATGGAAVSSFLATLLWAVVLVPFVALGKLRSFVLLALDRVFSSQFPIMFLRPALFLAGCVLIWRSSGGLTPQSAMAAQVAGAAAVMVIAMALFRRFRPPELALANPALAARKWIEACLPMGLTEGLRLLQGQVGLLLTGIFATAAQAGFYRVADAVTQVTALLVSVAGTAATQLFARLWSAGDSAGTERIAVLAAWAMTLGTLALGLPLALVGEWLFPLVFGADFAASVPVFRLLWGGLVLAGCGGLALALANMTGHHVLSTQSFGVILLVNLVVGGLLVPSGGALGAATGSAAGLLAGTAWCAWQLYRRTGINCTLANPAAWAILRDALRRGWQALADRRTGKFPR